MAFKIGRNDVDRHRWLAWDIGARVALVLPWRGIGQRQVQQAWLYQTEQINVPIFAANFQAVNAPHMLRETPMEAGWRSDPMARCSGGHGAKAW